MRVPGAGKERGEVQGLARKKDRVITEGVETERPSWIRGKASWSAGHEKVKGLLSELSLTSVCEAAACPRKGECWSEKHVTFMILGDTCTRACLFCNVKKGAPPVPEASEPSNVARAVKDLGIKYAVITSVTRDDLKDKGTGHFVMTVKKIKELSPGTLVELLIPDMDADKVLLEKIALSGAEVIGHNIEMPEKLYRPIRPKSDYQRSLRTLTILKDSSKGALVKSSLIIGLGESEEDILGTFKDILRTGAEILYIGQYLSPSKNHSPVVKYYTPEEFQVLKKKAEALGFRYVSAGPLVRSSYKAHEAYFALRRE